MSDLRILVVDDLPDVRLMVESLLSQKFPVKAVASASEASGELSKHPYALILLDVGLPDKDGFEFCAELKSDHRYKTIPVVFLTGRNEVHDRVNGFDLGADDYITKPLEPLEFQARIEAKMRQIKASSKPVGVFCNGEFQVDLVGQKVRRQVSSQMVELDLTANEFKLFYFFLTHPEQLLSRAEIFKHVWGDHQPVVGRTIDTHVYTLRQKLQSAGGYIQSVPKLGYKFSALGGLSEI